MVDLDGVPASLRERLGLEASGGLVQMFNRAGREWSADVLSVAAERFDRRLVEEASKVRIEMAQEFAAVRQEMAQGLSSVRQEMAEGFSLVRQEMAAQRADLIKWALLFWLGQVGATAAMLAFVLRGPR